MSVGKVCCAVVAYFCLPGVEAQEWTEAAFIERFESQSPQVRALRAGIAVAQAEARLRAILNNPAISYSREGAGYAEFIEASQTIQNAGRLRALRAAGAASIAATEANVEASLWPLRCDLRSVFFQAVAAQERVNLFTGAISDVERLRTALRQREEAGEGARYDRVRAERELGELRADLNVARALLVSAIGRLAAFLPEGANIATISGSLAVPSQRLDVDQLIARATAARRDYRAELKGLERFQAEEAAARRLNRPEPTVSAGIKRGNVVSGIAPNPFADVTKTALAFSVSVPIPAFNRGQYDVAKYQAEQSHAQARAAAVLARLKAEVQGAWEIVNVRNETLAAYRRELESSGSELTRITQVAYEEGALGILELLDSMRVNHAASLRLLDLRAALKDAFVQLERAIGEEVQP